MAKAPAPKKKPAAKMVAPKRPITPKKSAPKAAAMKAAAKAKPALAKAAPKKSAPKKSVPRKAAAAAAPVAVTPALKKRAATIERLLAEAYPEARTALNSRNAFELLCATILSAQCTDKKVNEIAPALFAAYPDAAAMAAANPEHLKKLIHQTGFFNNKAKSLLGMSRALLERHGGQVPGTMEELIQLPGVGRKTAWCILGPYFGRFGSIVDTHFKRLTTRLGLHAEEDPEKIEAAMDRLIGEPGRTAFSHRLISHGRAICDARKPLCGQCVLADSCPSAHMFDK